MSAYPVVLITGAARRLGATIARTLHAQNYNIILHYRYSQNEAETLCEQLNASRANSASAIFADLTQLTQLSALINSSHQMWGRLDALINNASLFLNTPVGSSSIEQWNNLIQTNLTAPYFLSEYAAPYLQTTKGSIINITDIHGQIPLKGYPIYSISKAGLTMMTLTLARELAPTIRVNAIAPGMTVLPEKSNVLNPLLQQELMNRTALKKLVDPADIAKAVIFLLEQQSMTGQVINVDCGRLIQI